MSTAYLALGTNLGPRRAILERALALLEADPRVAVTAVSPFEETAPLGQVQPAFVNAVARLETTLPPEVLLALCHRVERILGRVRSRRRWGPRTLDLDVLTYEGRAIRRPGLTLPHPGITRSFVVRPLAALRRETAPASEAAS